MEKQQENTVFPKLFVSLFLEKEKKERVMKIAELFGRGRLCFCEVFPPKKTSPVDSIYKTLDG
mgnify:CR=1 FL=1